MDFVKFKYERQKKIWGYEDWVISAHESGMSRIVGGAYDGMTLKDFFENNKSLLGIDENVKEFPLLVKIINANDELSVQVHPDDEYARKNENSLGKSECWYILDQKDSDIVVGLTAKTKEEFKQAIEDNSIMNKLNILNINKGDFFYIPPGCVHAIRSNTKILEIQQSSDVTYRVYDYNRKDNDGNLRELHIDKSLDVIDFNFKNENKISKIENTDYTEEILTDNEYFIVRKFTVKNHFNFKSNDKYSLCIPVEGEFTIDGEQLKNEEGIMILKDKSVNIIGNGMLIITSSK